MTMDNYTFPDFFYWNIEMRSSDTEEYQTTSNRPPITLGLLSDWCPARPHSWWSTQPTTWCSPVPACGIDLRWLCGQHGRMLPANRFYLREVTASDEGEEMSQRTIHSNIYIQCMQYMTQWTRSFPPCFVVIILTHRSLEDWDAILKIQKFNVVLLCGISRSLYDN